MSFWTIRGVGPLAVVVAASCGCGAPQSAGPEPTESASALAVEPSSDREPTLWASLEGAGSPTVVFISGNGSDHSVWLELEPKVRALGVRTVLYDRAGLGKSPLFAEPYRIDDEASALRTMLRTIGAPAPFVVVAHSYGGLIAALLAESNSEVAGMVYVDATLPGELGAPVVDSILATYRPQYDEVRRVAPELAKAVIPVVESYPATAERMTGVAIDPDLPVVLIAAEKPNASTPEWKAYVERARAAFAAGSSRHWLIIAEASGHNVMRDRPDVVVAAIEQVLEALPAAESR